jgi:hypothetical protein
MQCLPELKVEDGTERQYFAYPTNVREGRTNKYDARKNWRAWHRRFGGLA